MSGVQARGLVIGQGGFRAGPVDLALDGGRVVALIGPNGGGKTTLLKTLAGLIAPVAGEAKATDAAYLPPPGTVRAGFPARHLAALGRAGRRGWAAALNREDQRAARDAMDRLGVGDLADRAFDRLSSGQQQLVLIARLIVQDAAVCLLDEPLALLDPAHSAEVARAIAALAGEGRTVVVSTHDLHLAARADHVVSLGVGGIEQGVADQMLTPARLTLLYGATVTTCPKCGKPATVR